jgi:isoaspartyl peptidase/L-asparaginase-like protein (Ntn-hydrolase superfamily)
MQVEKIREAVSVAREFLRRAEEVLQQSDTAKFLLCDGKQAKSLKKISNRAIQALTEMRRP